MALASYSAANTTALDTTLVLAGETPHVRQITVASGAGVLTKGTLMGKITSGGKFIKSLAAASDGSETPVCILAEACDASSADVTTNAYFAGYFLEAGMTFGTGHTATNTRDALQAKGIFMAPSTAVR